MKTLLKWIKRTFFGLIFLIALLSIGIICILQWPQILINPRTLSIATQVAASQGIFVHWDSLDLDFKKKGLLKQQIFLDAQKLSIQTQDQSFSSHLEKVNFAFTIHLGLKGVHLEELNPIQIESSKMRLVLAPESKKASSEPSAEILPSWLSHAYLSNISIMIKRFELLSGRDRYLADLILETRLLPSESKAFKIQGSLKLPDRSLLRVQSQIDLKGKHKLRIADLANDLELQYQARANYRQGHDEHAFQLQGEINPSLINLQVAGSSWLSGEVLKRIHLTDCKAELSRTSAKEPTGKFKLNCPIGVTVDKKIFGSVLKDKFSENMNFNVKADLRSPTYPISFASSIEGEIEAEIQPFHNSLLSGSGNVKTQVSGVLSEFPKNWKLDTDVLANFAVDQFERVVGELRETSFAVPAPLHSLKGKIDTKIEGSGNLALFQFPFKISTQLRSPDQRIQSDGNGFVSWVSDEGKNFKVKAGLDLLLSEFQLVLPKLDLAALPRLSPDSRIKKKGEEKPQATSPSPVEYEIRVRSAAGHPIRILSNWAEKPIPIILDLTVSSENNLKGSIQVEEFPLNLFRRPAVLKKFSVTLATPTKDSKLDGLVEFDYTDYKVMVILADTIDKPRIQFRSDPYLSENQVVATLFFGHPIEELDPEQTASVGNARAGIANRAMDLASLYLLASTPIQSVNYDPVKKVVSAKVRLGNGTSLDVGTDTSALKAVGIRKHLGNNWSIQTHLNNPTDSNARSLSTFLEWSHRH